MFPEKLETKPGSCLAILTLSPLHVSRGFQKGLFIFYHRQDLILNYSFRGVCKAFLFRFPTAASERSFISISANPSNMHVCLLVSTYLRQYRSHPGRRASCRNRQSTYWFPVDIFQILDTLGPWLMGRRNIHRTWRNLLPILQMYERQLPDSLCCRDIHRRSAFHNLRRFQF